MKNIATRAAYGEALRDLGADYDFVVMDADLSGSTQTAVFGKVYPDRFINCGIAEANMISVAAGIAATGTPVFASSFAMFACGRAYEQIRNSVGYPHLNVKIGASHAGITVGEDGATHQYCEDIAVMRTIPEMMILNPADATEAYHATKAALLHDGPVYLRLGRFAVPVIFDRDSYVFDPNKAVPIKTGDDAVVFATGILVDAAIKAAGILSAEGIDVSVVNVHTVKPLDEKTVLEFAARTRLCITAEEHTIIGGLGSAVAEVLCEKLPTPLMRVGIEDKFGRSGKAAELLDYYGLNAAGIAAAVRRGLALKK